MMEAETRLFWGGSYFTETGNQKPHTAHESPLSLRAGLFARSRLISHFYS